MSFGKRTRAERQIVPGPPANVEELDLDETDVQSSVPKWQLMLLAGTAAILAVFCLAIFVLPKLMQPGGVVFSGAIEDLPKEPNQLVFDLPIRDVGEAKIKSNEALRTTCFTQEYSVTKVPAMIPGQVRKWQITDPASGRIYHSSAGSSDVLSCMLTSEMPRFCDSAERKNMASLLSAFSAGNRQAADRLVSASNQDNGTATDPSPELSLNAMMVTALNRVSSAGYLSSEDFSGSVPDEMAPFIAAAKLSPCN